MVAEFASPRLLFTFLDNCASLVKDSFAQAANDGIACRKLASVLEAVKAHSEDVSVELYLNFLALSLLSRVSSLSEVFTNGATVVLVTQVQIAVKLIGVHLLRRRVPVDFSVCLLLSLRRLRLGLSIRLLVLGEEASDGGEEAFLDLLLSGLLSCGAIILIFAFFNHRQVGATLRCCRALDVAIFGEGLSWRKRVRLGLLLLRALLAVPVEHALADVRLWCC